VLRRPLESTCAEYAAEAAGLESLAARLRETAAHGISLLEQGQGGETAPPPDADMRGRYRVVAEAVGARPTMLAADASLIRLSLARDANVLTTAIETAQDAGAETATQKMIAHQLAAAHPLAMELLTAAATEVQKCRLSPHHNPESLAEAARTTTAAARLMDSFARGALILDRLRNGARQSVLVQHVMVSDGAVHAPAAAAVARAAATGLGDHLVQSMPAIAAAVRRAG
jgi:hypothetical protein